MNYKVGDFIITNKSSKPALIINKRNLELLISIVEYKGDYLWVAINEIELINLEPEEKMSILSLFGSWFYKEHTLIYQELLLELLNKYL